MVNVKILSKFELLVLKCTLKITKSPYNDVQMAVISGYVLVFAQKDLVRYVNVRQSFWSFLGNFSHKYRKPQAFAQGLVDR